MNDPADGPSVTVTFAGTGDAFGSGGRYQACIHLRGQGRRPVLNRWTGGAAVPAVGC